MRTVNERWQRLRESAASWAWSACILLTLCLGRHLCAADAVPAGSARSDVEAAAGYRWYGLPIEVDGLPESAPHAPISVQIDFGSWSEQLPTAGVVDRRSLQLFRCSRDGTQSEVVVQFLPDDQPRWPTRRFQPDTVSDVSYVTEFPPEDLARAPQPSGTLTWMAGGGSGEPLAYRLRFAVATQGRAVQVPYAPGNLQVFDDQGRATQARSFARMQIRPQWPLLGPLRVLEDRQEVTAYFPGPNQDDAKAATAAIRRPLLYPVRDPDGFELTELGKAHDPTGSHRHHYSLWIAHNDVSGHNFWSDRGGLIAHEGWELLEDGPVFCRIAVRNLWMDAGEPILRERRTMTFYRASQDTRAIDFELQYQPAGSDDVRLGSTTFGFLSVRTAQSMTPFDGGGEILNAHGQRNEQAAHRQRAAWIDLAGPVAQDRWSGIALLDHPGNLNHPTPWHCRNDGWACASVNYECPHTLRAGEKLALRYRVVLHAGDSAAAGIAGHFAAFTSEPDVRLGTPQRESVNR